MMLFKKSMLIKYFGKTNSIKKLKVIAINKLKFCDKCVQAF